MKILSAKEFGSRLRVSIQSSGRLSFTQDTVTSLGLTPESRIKIGQDDVDPGLLYLIVPGTPDEDAFEVRTSGKYYYLPTKSLFDALGIKYVGENIMFDLIRMKELDAEACGITYKMVQRTAPEDGTDE